MPPMRWLDTHARHATEDVGKPGQRTYLHSVTTSGATPAPKSEKMERKMRTTSMFIEFAAIALLGYAMIAFALTA
jgi:hypothetical protein